MRIAVDVMGGDHGPDVVIHGVQQALASDPEIQRIHLVGDQGQIESGLEKCGLNLDRIEIHHTDQVLTMDDKPVVGLRKKKRASVLLAVDLVKQGEVQALVSPGNTGGVVAASTIRLRRLPGVDRACIATVMPRPKGHFVLLDVGATVDCKPAHLLHFALMGKVFAEAVLQCSNPRIGLLNVGTEDVKGNELTIESFKLCQKIKNLNFVGNVEGHDLFEDCVDVVVCDGFVGNIVLKSCENLANGIFGWLKDELMRNPIRKAGALLARGAFRTIRERTDSENYGGAPLLGLNGNVMIMHGSCREKSVRNAMRVTKQTLNYGINSRISEEVSTANQILGLCKST
jgi:glycerol-3-phosphate acyltransferase PlsX